MFSQSTVLTRRVLLVINSKRNARIPFWDFLKSTFQSRSNPETVKYRKRIAGFQPVKTELAANRTYYWCSCGYAQHQALCDQSCRQTKGEFQPLKFTSPRFQLADLCMCKTTSSAPYCDQSCRDRYAGMQMRMGDGVQGTYKNMKTFIDTIPKGLESYREFAADRQAKLELTEKLRKKYEEAKEKKK